MRVVTDNEVAETTTTTGTGTYTLAGAHGSYDTFAVVGDGNQCYYYAYGDDGYEVGKGTYTASGTTLSRDAILDSSNGGAAVNWSAGTKYIFLALPESKVQTDIDATAAGAIPTGLLAMYGGGSAPTGWLLCDGSAVSRTTYADLFSVCGTTFGAGDGSTTFNLPDMRATFPVGAQSGGDYDLGDTGGAETHTLTESEIPSHTHGAQWYNGTKDAGSPVGASLVTQNTSNATNPPDTAMHANTITSAGGGGAHENRPPFLAVSFIIKT